jgi:predicted house-cleaning NTP pyrophosphatase (Maf/HAM1 superfamily)
MLPANRSSIALTKDSYVRGDLPVADGGGLCRARRRAELWIEVTVVSAANVVGLSLAVLIALLLAAALVFPERF